MQKYRQLTEVQRYQIEALKKGYVIVNYGIFIKPHRPMINSVFQLETNMKSAEFMQWVAAIGELDNHQRKLLSEALHQQSEELNILELIEANFDTKNTCPHCSGVELYRHGVVSGLQRYYCQHCHKTFNALTGTPLAHLREKPKWLDYLAAVSQSRTVRQSATDAGIHRNTSFRWRHRFLNWISQDCPTMLHGITEADEMYLLESNKGQRNLGRNARMRGCISSKRGISVNKSVYW